MAALPEAIQYHNVIAGFMEPDWEPLNDALEPFRNGPIVDDMRQLGHAILAISDAMPKAGKQGVFPYVYGDLTLHLADAIDGKQPSFLPRIKNKEDLMRQAGHFAEKYTTPVDHIVQSALAAKRGDTQARDFHAQQVPLHYHHSFENPQVQFGHPVLQFGAGMVDHIVGDLGWSLDQSGVSKSYMRPLGDYDNVNWYIRYVAHKNSEALMGGNAMVRRGVIEPTVIGIAGMRQFVARPNYTKLQKAESHEDYHKINLRSERQARWVGELLVTGGNRAIPAYSALAGADVWPPVPVLPRAETGLTDLSEAA